MASTTRRTPSPPSFPPACSSPGRRCIWAAFFNVLAFAVFQLSVAATVGKGIVDPAFVDNRLIFGALVGAISWNLITWYYGIPSSSSHALIGGMIGAALAKAGTAPLLAPGIIKTAAFIVVSPLLGHVAGLAADAARLLALFPPDAATRGQMVPPAAAGVLRRLQHGPRRQRRAENHGHHLAAADRRRRRPRRITCRSGWW